MGLQSQVQFDCSIWLVFAAGWFLHDRIFFSYGAVKLSKIVLPKFVAALRALHEVFTRPAGARPRAKFSRLVPTSSLAFFFVGVKVTLRGGSLQGT